MYLCVCLREREQGSFQILIRIDLTFGEYVINQCRKACINFRTNLYKNNFLTILKPFFDRFYRENYTGNFASISNKYWCYLLRIIVPHIYRFETGSLVFTSCWINCFRNSSKLTVYEKFGDSNVANSHFFFFLLM